MKIGIFSDLHTEFRRGPEGYGAIQRFIARVNNSDVDLVINAGDTHPDAIMRSYVAMGISKPYFEILGNHDFYGAKVIPYQKTYQGKELKIAGATLWTDFGKGNVVVMGRYGDCLVDKRHIIPITDSLEEDLLGIHRADLKFIETQKADIVVTHHAPSFKSLHEKYKQYSLSNCYFMSDLEDFIMANSHIKLWVHGHTHTPFDYMIGGCRIICNPLGYPGETYRTDDDYNMVEVEIG